MDNQESRLVTEIKACRVCDGPIDSILNFGQMPLANRYLKSPDEPDIHAPLEVVLCANCGCVQLRHTVDPKILYEDYLYTSSTSGSLSEYFRKYAQDTVDKLGLKPGDEPFIVGIGGNDGPLEKAYQSFGFKVLNVEPSQNIAELSLRNKVPTWCDWFGEDVAMAIFEEHGSADLITANHVFAHMPDINGVVRAIKILLKPGGTFIFEESYWKDLVAGNHFDQIYHEHVFYWTVKALEKLFQSHGMLIEDIEYNKSQGGSIRVFVRNNPGESRGRVDCAIAIEIMMAGLFDTDTYFEWKSDLWLWKTKCRAFLAPLINSLSCYGAPAKFAMISEQIGFTPENIAYVVEDSPIKIGRYTPGSHIPIVNRQHFIEHPTEYCIITAANYADMIIKANPQYKGKWILLNPEPRFL